MLLHKNNELFEQLITAAAVEFNLPEAIVEKDYFVTLLLRRIAEKQPDIIFKGGTSLSKCYHIIDRFSEDIDLNVLCDSKPTEGQRRKLKEHIAEAIEELGFVLTNPDDIRSRRDFNRYVVDYSSQYKSDYLNKNLIVETSVFIRAYPCNRVKASCFINDYLRNHNHTDVISEYGLDEFELNVQTIERTFIDKVFAVCDYYLDGAPDKHSRHIYDLHQMMPGISFNSDFKKLIAEVRADRQPHKTCLSAQDGVNINTLLGEIAGRDFYRKDYESITIPLLFKTVDYQEAKKSITEIASLNLF